MGKTKKHLDLREKNETKNLTPLDYSVLPLSSHQFHSFWLHMPFSTYTTISTSNSTPAYLLKWNKNLDYTKTSYTNYYSKFIHNYLKPETTQMSSTKEWRSKLWYWYIHMLEHYSAISNKRTNYDKCNNMYAS